MRKAGHLGEEAFFNMIRRKVQAALNGYIVSRSLGEAIDEFITPPLLGDDAGICGALALAQEALT